MKYIDAEKLIAEIEDRLHCNGAFDEVNYAWHYNKGMIAAYNHIKEFITSLQQEHEIVELSFKGGTYRVNGEEHAFKGGKAKVIVLEINQEEENE